MKFQKSEKMRFYFDQEADVLYLSKGKPSKDDSSREIGEDIVMRFNPKSKQVTGLTIINFTKRSSKKSTDYNFPFEVELHPLI